MRVVREKVMQWVFFASAIVCVLAIALICWFLFANGMPAMLEIGLLDFLSGKTWSPSSGMYGILPMILGSIYVTAGALVVGVPLGVLTAIYLSFFCSKRLYHFLHPMIEILAGIPSVVYGFFGLMVISPLVRVLFAGKGGLSIFTASLLLGMMILPTIISVSENALKAVPSAYLEGALALGATKERSIFRVVLPAAKSGVTAGIVLGIGRAVGETMAVVMVAGNQARMPAGILKGVRTLTANIVLEMGYAAELHRGALIATGVVLFVFILLLNLLVSILRGRKK